MKRSDSQFDVIIIGGGMVGAAMAALLAKTILRVAVLDAGKRVEWAGGDFDLRVSAITRASQNIFETAGAWGDMERRRVYPYSEMHVWDSTGTGEIHFDCADVCEPTLGYIIENSVVQSALFDCIDRADNIDYRESVRPASLEVNESTANVTLQDGQTLSAKLIIGADGARSWVRDQTDIDVVGWPYGQKGIVATVTTHNSHRDTAWQRFLPSGPLALLPVADKICSIVWSNMEADADRLMALSDDAFLNAINQALGESPLGSIVDVSKRAAFPLRLQHATEYCRHRVVLIGDAAHTIHPLAGQGVNLGFLDVAALADVIEHAIQRRKDIGSYTLLRRYERARKGDNVMMMGAMDGFKRLFCNTNQPAMLLRNMGLNLANHIQPLKNRFVHHAMGMARDLPTAARTHIRE